MGFYLYVFACILGGLYLMWDSSHEDALNGQFYYGLIFLLNGVVFIVDRYRKKTSTAVHTRKISTGK